jgi:hypothetical protein
VGLLIDRRFTNSGSLSLLICQSASVPQLSSTAQTPGFYRNEVGRTKPEEVSLSVDSWTRDGGHSPHYDSFCNSRKEGNFELSQKAAPGPEHGAQERAPQR